MFDAVFVALGAAFVASAQDLVAATLATLDASTRVDLSAGWFSDNMGVLAAVSLPVLVGLLGLPSLWLTGGLWWFRPRVRRDRWSQTRPG